MVNEEFHDECHQMLVLHQEMMVQLDHFQIQRKDVQLLCNFYEVVIQLRVCGRLMLLDRRIVSY